MRAGRLEVAARAKKTAHPIFSSPTVITFVPTTTGSPDFR